MIVGRGQLELLQFDVLHINYARRGFFALICVPDEKITEQNSDIVERALE